MKYLQYLNPKSEYLTPELVVKSCIITAGEGGLARACYWRGVAGERVCAVNEPRHPGWV